MDALVMRMSQLDTEAAGALRVVMFYDTLMRRRVDLPVLVRASAGLAECVAGIKLHGSGRVIRFAPDGKEARDSTLPARTTEPIMLDDEEIGITWLERPGATPLDETLLERLAIAAASVVERYGPAHTAMADPALVELVISADDAAQARALRLLGFSVDQPLSVAAVRSGLPLDQVAKLIAPNRPVKAASLADAGVILATTIAPEQVPADVRMGIGSGNRPGRSWRQARTALRFTTAHQPIVRHNDLGALGLLAQIPEEALRDNADVAAVAHLGDKPEDLETLEIYCATGSLRRAADLLHLHHSSVSRRLQQIGETLHIDLTTPTGLVRARLALTAWQLLGANEREGRYD